MKIITHISLILIFSTISFAHDDNVPHYVNMENSTDLVNPDGFYEYMILKGDYLWMLAGKFYNDPYKWSDINNGNPYIVDPNWIYPNNWLVIPNVFTDDNGNPIYATASQTDDMEVSVEESTVADEVSTSLTSTKQIDSDGDGIVDGIDLDGDGVIDGNDMDGDGEINVQSSAALAADYGIDSDGDGNIDSVDLNGNGLIDEQIGIDVNGDGVVDGYDTDGNGKIDILAGVVSGATTVAAEKYLDDEEKDTKKSCVKSYCGKPGWKLGFHAGYPVGGGPKDENLNLGLLLGTPLGVKVGPLSVGLGAGAFTYNFENIYFGAGVLASLCINDLLKLDIPLILQLHGAGFYIFGEDHGFGAGVIGSASMPLGQSPLSLGLYGALGKYYPSEDDYNWSNVGVVLFYNF